ncbi:MAG TPA: PLP-dependent aminotransferase family protein, partial [Azospirillaceae bacterium]|nr:PLP-dependent aminotransferase family protein [Azospirillaceae bacterium]
MSFWIQNIANRPGPRYKAIVAALAEDIAAGRIAHGTKLPPHRELAYRLKVTIGTIARAYGEAERQGLVSGEVGRGTFVRPPPPAAEPLPAHKPKADGTIDMSVNRPAVLDVPALAAAFEAVARHADLASLMSYGSGAHDARTRAVGASWIARDGFEVAPERVIPNTGGQSGIFASVAALTRPGDTLLCEELTYPGLKNAAALLERRLEPLSMDEHGLVPAALDRALAEGRSRVLYLMPTVHNPTTITMPEARREEIARILVRHDAWVIEDGLYAFLHQHAPLPLAARVPERTVYLTSLSKAVAPALRIGYAAAP